MHPLCELFGKVQDTMMNGDFTYTIPVESAIVWSFNKSVLDCSASEIAT